MRFLVLTFILNFKMKNKILNLVLIFENWISKDETLSSPDLYFSEEILIELVQIKEENSLILFYSWFKKNKVIFAGLKNLKYFFELLIELYGLNQNLFDFQYSEFIRDLISYNLYYAGYKSYDLKEELRSKELFHILLIIEKDLEFISDDIKCLKRTDTIKSNLDVEDDC
jgi:hypothetical protein